MTARILVVEDDPAITTLLEYNLKSAGYAVQTVSSAEDAEVALEEENFDLVVLDWMLPEASGLEFCARLRRGRRASFPILMLTARGEETDRVRGLATGADDYVVKPFSVPEVLARISALLRRSAPERIADVLEAGTIRMDRLAHRVTRRERIVDLGPTEYKLLETLLENRGRVLSRSQIIDRVWGNTTVIDERTIDVHVGRLRKALVRGPETDPVRTIRGAGYTLDIVED
jgi:two-component system phosphate regulon response regulator PhoB